jgi:hypothetical protein
MQGIIVYDTAPSLFSFFVMVNYISIGFLYNSATELFMALYSLIVDHPKYRSKGPSEGNGLSLHFTYPLLDHFQTVNVGEM